MCDLSAQHTSARGATPDIDILSGIAYTTAGYSCSTSTRAKNHHNQHLHTGLHMGWKNVRNTIRQSVLFSETFCDENEDFARVMGYRNKSRSVDGKYQALVLEP